MLSETVTGVDFDAFYRGQRRSLVRFVMFLGCANADTAEDIVHTAFARAFPVWATIRCPQAWLRKVAQNEYIRYCRFATREKSLDAASPRAEWVSGVSAALALEQRDDTREVLASVIADLPPKQRQVMAWHWDGFSDAEIAAELGYTPAGVRQNRSRAMKTLRRSITRLERGAK